MTRRLAIVWNPSKTDRDTLTEGLHAAVTHAPAPEVSWWETTEDDPGGGATGRAMEWNPDLVVSLAGMAPYALSRSTSPKPTRPWRWQSCPWEQGTCWPATSTSR